MSNRTTSVRQAGADAPGAAVAERPGGGPKPRTVSCLLIDDSRFDRQRLRRIAEQTAIEVTFTEAGNLDAALNALRAHPFDVILLDQNLPDGEGTTVVELLNRHLGEHAPPIIMISGSQEAALPARAFASGCRDYISKEGLTIPGLEKAITASLAKARKAAPNGTVTLVEHREALKSFADDTVLELRIPLSRMLRLIARVSDRHPAAAAELADLKALCRDMWEYLDHLSQGALEKGR